MKIRKMTSLAMLSIVVAALAAATATAKSARHASAATRTLTISYRDLDVERPEGATVLYSRVKAAAERVCGPAERELGAVAARRECIEVAIERAIRDASVPQLTMLHVTVPSRS